MDVRALATELLNAASAELLDRDCETIRTSIEYGDSPSAVDFAMKFALWGWWEVPDRFFGRLREWATEVNNNLERNRIEKVLNRETEPYPDGDRVGDYTTLVAA